ncbi:hypothetical protein L211DRAFT_893603 [Terfezia boudieri ATCC MYA-4762]|uniref:Uncharacterized protein n=1 Tax=Terfezia boudieri ATCC MYA-4762 TaxID=1051890 RepID=A0A3N4LI37_9PEZI|nr:hypothetical protein L211DRAFT_893603 [Terfezia boudieri ATCC MYA-4762]
MALKCLGLTSSGRLLLLLTIILLSYTAVDAIRLPPLDELNSSTAISKPTLIERRESTENLPADHESTDHEPVLVAKKKKPQVVRLGIKHEEHGTTYLPAPAQQPTTSRHFRRGQQNILEDYYAQRLGTRNQYEGQDGHPTFPYDTPPQDPYDQNTVDPQELHLRYGRSPTQDTEAQNRIYLARRGLELVKGNCFLPDPAGNKCYINKCHCITYDTGVGSEFGSSTGECWCPMIDAGRPHSKREFFSETNPRYEYSQMHKRDLRGGTQPGSDHLFVYQQPNNMKQDPGLPKIYRREPEPLPARKKNNGRGDDKQTGKYNKGTKKQHIEGKKAKSRMKRRNAYMYQGQHHDFELEL